MIKKIILIFALFIAGCQSKPKIDTIENKKALLQKFEIALESGQLEKLNVLTNVNIKIQVPNPEEIEEVAYLQTVFEDLEVNYLGENEIEVKNYVLSELIDKTKVTIASIEGIDIAKKALTIDQKKSMYISKLKEVKSQLSKKITKLKIKFVQEKEELKLDFEDSETVKMFQAALGN